MNNNELLSTNIIFNKDKINSATIKTSYKLYAFDITQYKEYLKEKNKHVLSNIIQGIYKEQFSFPFVVVSSKEEITIFFMVSAKVEEEAFFLDLSLFVDSVVHAKQIDFDIFFEEQPPSVLVKLLLSSYFSKKYGICFSNYLHRVFHKKGPVQKALSINIVDVVNEPEVAIACNLTYFLRVTPQNIKQCLSEEKFYYQYVPDTFFMYCIDPAKATSILENLENSEQIYFQTTERYASLIVKLLSKKFNWHILDEENSKNVNLPNNFIDAFQFAIIMHVNNFLGKGVAVRKRYTVTKFEAGITALPVSATINKQKVKLNGLLSEDVAPVIGVVDMRRKETEFANKQPLPVYMKIISACFDKAKMTFLPMSIEEAKASNVPLLILHDVSHDNFHKHRVMYGYNNDALDVFAAFSAQRPVELYNVNIKESMLNPVVFSHTNVFDLQKEFFSYPAKFNEYQKVKLSHSVRNLLFKKFILRQQKVFNETEPSLSLPYYDVFPELRDVCFMYDNFAVTIDNQGYLQFLDLTNFNDKQVYDALLARYDIDWEYVVLRYLKHKIQHVDYIQESEQKNFLLDTISKSMKIQNSRFIITNKTVIGIEAKQERALIPQKTTLNKNTHLPGVSHLYFTEDMNKYIVGMSAMNLKNDNTPYFYSIHEYKKSKISLHPIYCMLTTQFNKRKMYYEYPYIFELLELYLHDIVHFKNWIIP